jgi:hypothetical protein
MSWWPFSRKPRPLPNFDLIKDGECEVCDGSGDVRVRGMRTKTGLCPCDNCGGVGDLYRRTTPEEKTSLMLAHLITQR